MRDVAVVCASGMLLNGCTPTRSTLREPFPYADGLVSAQRLQSIATRQCAASVPGRALPPHDFTTDGCSGWPNGSWTACCVAHDTAYWCGGSRAARLQADRELRSCVQARSNKVNATLMYWGVRAGGVAHSPFPWRWGYGFDWGKTP